MFARCASLPAAPSVEPAQHALAETGQVIQSERAKLHKQATDEAVDEWLTNHFKSIRGKLGKTIPEEFLRQAQSDREIFDQLAGVLVDKLNEGMFELFPEIPAEVLPSVRQQFQQRVQDESNRMLTFWCSLLPPVHASTSSKPTRFKGVTKRR